MLVLVRDMVDVLIEARVTVGAVVTVLRDVRVIVDVIQGKVVVRRIVDVRVVNETAVVIRSNVDVDLTNETDVDVQKTVKTILDVTSLTLVIWRRMYQVSVCHTRYEHLEVCLRSTLAVWTPNLR